MRRLPALLLAVALVAAGIEILGARATAQQTMQFRPVPAESVSRLADVARRAARSAVREARRNVRVRLDSLDNEAASGADQAGSGVPEPPDAPDVPSPPVAPTETSGEILRFGSNIEVREEQVVNGDVVSLGGDVEVLGHVKGNVTALGGDVTLRQGCRVDGDVVSLGGTLHEDPGASVGGQRVTAPGMRRHGRMLLPMLAVLGTGFQVLVHVVWMLFLVGIAWMIVKLAPGRTQLGLDTLRSEPGMSFVIGLLVWALIIPSVIVLALVIALLCITIIGIPLAAAVAVGYVAFFVVAGIWGSVLGAALLGGRVRDQLRPGEASLMSSALWGVVALQGLRIVGDLLHVIPMFGFFGGLFHVIGWVLGAVLGTLGMGALIRSEYRRRTVQDWWQRTRGGGLGSAAPPPGPAAPPPAAPPPATA